MSEADLIAALRALYDENDERLRREFDRSLSFADGLFDRWERARRLGFADGASIYNSSLVYGDVTVGAGSWIGPFTLLDGSGGGIAIGSTCSISAGVHVYTHDTVGWSISGGVQEKRTGRVEIGDRTYIGSQSIVALGVVIGRQCVVAAGSFVNRSVPDRTVVGGTPARPLGRVVGEGADARIEYDAA